MGNTLQYVPSALSLYRDQIRTPSDKKLDIGNLGSLENLGRLVRDERAKMKGERREFREISENLFDVL